MNRNVTFIDDLPSLDELEHSGGGAAIRNKYIRNNAYNPPEESGMASYKQDFIPQISYSQHQQMQPQFDFVEQQPSPYYSSSSELSCITVAEHTKNCIVCSRLYNNDVSGYIIVIVLLAILSIILMKRILNV
jgi:hypothetical protein